MSNGVVRRLGNGDRIRLFRGLVKKMTPEIRCQLARLRSREHAQRSARFSFQEGLMAIYAVNDAGEIVAQTNWYLDGSRGGRDIYVRRSSRRKGIGAVLYNEASKYGDIEFNRGESLPSSGIASKFYGEMSDRRVQG